MAVADKIVALLDTLTPASLDALSPVQRRQFGDLCRHWADIAEQPKGAPAARPDVTTDLQHRPAAANSQPARPMT
jgi:hypothetical protein